MVESFVDGLNEVAGDGSRHRFGWRWQSNASLGAVKPRAFLGRIYRNIANHTAGHATMSPDAT